MAKKKMKIACLSAIGFLSLGICLTLNSAESQVKAENQVKVENYAFTQETALQENLQRGDVLSIPKGYFGNQRAQQYVYCPNGDVYSADTLKLEQYGEYTVQYIAEISGKTYTEEMTFTVENTPYSFLNVEDGATVAYGYNSVTQREGLILSIPEASTFVYNQPIDLREGSRENPTMRYTYIPVPDACFGANKIYMTFTDVYDPSKQITIRTTHCLYAGEPFWGTVQAKAEGQYFAGYDKNGAMRINEKAGAQNVAYFTDMCYDGKFTQVFQRQAFYFWYDMETNALYGAYTSLSTGKDNAMKLIVDFDDPSYQNVLFEGFTTGEVYLSIYCEDYNLANNDIQLLSMAGTDLVSTEISELSPTIQINSEDYDLNNLPKGQEGKSYPVFDAVAYDVSRGGRADVEKKVFFGYSKSAGLYNDGEGKFIRQMPIVNGRFATPYEGTYAISYVYYTAMGERFEKVVTLQVDNRSISLNDISIEEHDSTAEPYERVTLADIENVGGGAGNLTVTRSITLNGKSVTILKERNGSYSFQPKETGNYTVSYTVTDLCGNTKTASYTVNVTQQTAPVFCSNAELPRYFLANAEYVLPNLTAMDANQGKTVESNITIIDGKGERSYENATAATFTANADGNAVIRYSAGNRTVEYIVPVVDVAGEGNVKLDLAKYFVTSANVQTSRVGQGIKMAISDTGTAGFIREIAMREFSLNLNWGSLGRTFGKMNLILTDSKDENIKVKITIGTESEKYWVGVNDELLAAYGKVGAEEIVETITYDESKLAAVLGAHTLYFRETLDGEKFTGFTSGCVYLDFSFESVESASYIYVAKINNQLMSITSDTIVPRLYLDEVYVDTVKNVGDEVKIIPATAYDVLGPTVKVTVTVMYEGDYVKVNTGETAKDLPVSADSNYSFTITAEGEYTITYVVKDWVKKASTTAIVIRVFDLEKPQIQVENMPNSIGLGTVTLPTATVSDNATLKADISTYTLVRMPSGRVVLVTNNKFEATELGTYLITYYAMDEIGNVATISYEYRI